MDGGRQWTNDQRMSLRGNDRFPCLIVLWQFSNTVKSPIDDLSLSPLWLWMLEQIDEEDPKENRLMARNMTEHSTRHRSWRHGVMRVMC